MAIKLKVNGQIRQTVVDPEKPLLWTLREDLGLNGTKFGCGVGVCRACTVLVDGKVGLSCLIQTGEVGEAEIVTIEGLAGGAPHPLQAAWIIEDVPQCGYCQPGMIMAAAGLLLATPRPTDAEIIDGIPNICRCGTYPRIKKAIRRAADTMALAAS